MTKECNLPKEVMDQLAERMLIAKMMDPKNRHGYKPGDIYNNLGPVKKQILKDLKSDDISDVRWP